MKYNPDFKDRHLTYADGEVFLAMPALNLESRWSMPTAATDWATPRPRVRTPISTMCSRALRKDLRLCEEVYERLDQSHPVGCQEQSVRALSGVGHHPCAVRCASQFLSARYGWDMDHFKEIRGSATEENGWENYISEFIAPVNRPIWKKSAGRARVALEAARVLRNQHHDASERIFPGRTDGRRDF